MTMSDPTIAVVGPATLPSGREFPEDDTHWRNQAIETGIRGIESHVPVRYQGATASDPVVAEWVRTLVAGARDPKRSAAAIRRGPSLLIVGSVGSGKTYQAYGAVRALAVSGAYCGWLFTTAADCYAALRPRSGVDSEQEFERYARAGLLVLDDLGAAKGSEWTEEINYRLINHRYEHERPTLITSNVPPKQLADALGARVASRLAEMTTQVVLKGSDRRRRSA
jgi:DNA replication protein DnaC